MKKGFTLTEILVALSIVGIIATLTIPSVFGEYKEKVYSAQLKKVYSQITTAIKAEMNDEQEGSIQNFYQTSAGLSESSNTSGAQYFLENYFKLAKKVSDCGISCTPSDGYKTKGGNDLSFSDHKCAELTTGTLVCMRYSEDLSRSTVMVDVNGKKKPNVAGVDTFVFVVTPSGLLVDVNESGSCSATCSGKLEACAGGCFVKVMKNGWKIKLDY